MAVRHFSLTVAAVPVRLSDVYGDGVGVVDAAHDIPYREILLQAATAAIEIGESDVTTTDYGVLLAAAGFPLPIGSLMSGSIKLSDFYAISTSATLHILAIPY